MILVELLSNSLSDEDFDFIPLEDDSSSEVHCAVLYLAKAIGAMEDSEKVFTSVQCHHLNVTLWRLPSRTMEVWISEQFEIFVGIEIKKTATLEELEESRSKADSLIDASPLKILRIIETSLDVVRFLL